MSKQVWEQSTTAQLASAITVLWAWIQCLYKSSSSVASKQASKRVSQQVWELLTTAQMSGVSVVTAIEPSGHSTCMQSLYYGSSSVVSKQ